MKGGPGDKHIDIARKVLAEHNIAATRVKDFYRHLVNPRKPQTTATTYPHELHIFSASVRDLARSISGHACLEALQHSESLRLRQFFDSASIPDLFQFGIV